MCAHTRFSKRARDGRRQAAVVRAARSRRRSLACRHSRRTPLVLRARFVCFRNLLLVLFIEAGDIIQSYNTNELRLNRSEDAEDLGVELFTRWLLTDNFKRFVEHRQTLTKRVLLSAT